MPIITTTAIGMFLGACLLKAGEKISEKSIEHVFENKGELFERFKGLFNDEIITLGLNENPTFGEVQNLLEDKPEIATSALNKLNNNPELLADLNKQLQEIGNVTINAKNIAAAGNVNITNQTNNFS